MRVYLDNCCLQRPLDDQTQPRIKVETEAVLAILSSTRAGDLVLLGSEALDFEISRIPDVQRRDEAKAVLALAAEHWEISDEAQSLAETLSKYGISAMDALHLALASVAKADYFTTCDDNLLKKARSVKDLACKVVSLLGLVAEVTE
jgi:predicted nucleic acid-binding protein